MIAGRPSRARRAVEEVLRQQRDVLAALAQRRQRRSGPRSGGRYRSSRNAPCLDHRARRSRLVAAMTRTSTCDRRVPPTRSNSPLLQHAQQLRLRSQRAARRSRRGRACRRRPARSGPALLASAPVNAPFSWPNSSLSSSVARQRRAVDARRTAAPRAADAAWIARATSSLPVPVSPAISTVLSVAATCAISSRICTSNGERPSMPSLARASSTSARMVALRASISRISRAFSIAMVACSAKLSSSATSLWLNGPGSGRPTAIAPIG